jgi:hypothetical protein
MIERALRALLVACTAAALAAPHAAAQSQQPILSPDEEISPRQVQTVPPARPARRTLTPAASPPPVAAAAPAAAAPARNGSAAAGVVACSGLFAKDSSHVKLAQFFQKNADFGQVSGSGGSALNATILYPNNPKLRLEVLWQNEAARSDISVIVITGQSQWKGPKGLRLGLALAALEKLNGKPFKLSGFDQPEGSAAIDWQSGALAQLPGDCNVGVKFAADRKATPDQRAAAAGAEFLSNDAAIRAVKPAIAEIIIGYSQ